MAKLDGTFRIPVNSAGAANVEQTELQKSIFDAPPAAPAATKPADQVMKDAGEAESRSQKRARDDESSDEDVAMEEDSSDDE